MPGTAACSSSTRTSSSARSSSCKERPPGRSRHGSVASVFDHVGVRNSDLAASERFYRTVLSVLGVEASYAGADMVGWGDWWIGPTDAEHPVTRGLHVAFRARDRTQVDAVWRAGVDAGYHDDGAFLLDPDGNSVEADHGAPGERAVYHPGYYGAFVLDPDGHNVEVVNHNSC